MSNEDSHEENKIRVELLDSGSGRIVQFWTFPCSEMVSIGRAPENQIVIQDPYVSRHHADLRFVLGQWLLTNRGRHGILLDGNGIVESPLPKGAATFQLGGLGPTLRTSYGQPVQRSLDTTVITSPGLPSGSLGIDHDRMRREVEMIAETPYFRELQQVRQRLKAARAEA
jgi:hypothetical protein